MKTGQCKFGVTCKFHHPQPAGVPAPVPGPGPLHAPAAVPAPAPAIYPTVQSPSVQSSQQYGVVPGNWPVARPTLLPGSYIHGTYGPMLIPPGVVPFPGWTSYPVCKASFFSYIKLLESVSPLIWSIIYIFRHQLVQLPLEVLNLLLGLARYMAWHSCLLQLPHIQASIYQCHLRLVHLEAVTKRAHSLKDLVNLNANTIWKLVIVNLGLPVDIITHLNGVQIRQIMSLAPWVYLYVRYTSMTIMVCLDGIDLCSSYYNHLIWNSELSAIEKKIIIKKM